MDFDFSTGSNDRAIIRIATTIINVEEQLRGRLAVIKKQKSGLAEVRAYLDLCALIDFFGSWTILPFDHTTAMVLEGFQARMVQRIGPMDCKIAAVALVYQATLLSANLTNFRQIPGLKVEDWLRED